MTALLDDEMRLALEPWNRQWTPPKLGLFNVSQYTALQLLKAGSQGSVDWCNWEASFLQGVVRTEGNLTALQDHWLNQLLSQYDCAIAR